MKIKYSFLTIALILLAFVSCKKEDAILSGNAETKTVTFTVGSPVTKLATDDTDAGGVSFTWEDTDKMGSYVDSDVVLTPFSVVDGTIEGSMAMFRGDIAMNAMSLRLIYPYNADTLLTSKFPVDLTLQSGKLNDPVHGKSCLMISSDKIGVDMYGNPIDPIELKHISSTAKFLFKFKNLDIEKSLSLKSLKVSSLATKAEVDLNVACGAEGFYSTPSTDGVLIEVIASPVLENDVEYRLDAAVIPFVLPAGDLLFTATFSDNSTLTYTKSVAAEYDFTAGNIHPVGKDGDIVFAAQAAVDEPAKLTSINMTPEDKLELTFSSKLSEASLSTDCGLIVMRNDVAMTITDIAVGSTSYKVVIGIGDGGIWNGDDVKVSYTTGTLETPGGNPVVAITDNVVDGVAAVYAPYNHNLIPNGDFEDASPLPVVFNQWSPYTGESFISFPTSSFGGAVASGEKCMKVGPVILEDPNVRIMDDANRIKLKVGAKYKGHSYFQGEGNINGLYQHIVIVPYDSQGKWWDSSICTMWIGGPAECGIWHQDSKDLDLNLGATIPADYVLPESGEIDVYVRFPAIKTGDITLYYDKVELYEYKKHE